MQNIRPDMNWQYLTLSLLLGIFMTPVAKALPSLPEVEQTLIRLAQEVQDGKTLDAKIQKNREFSRLLIETLKRPESYDYGWDKMESISILKPEDQSFRIFSWYLLDNTREADFNEQYYYYFGLVQRKYQEAGKTEYVIIPLLEMKKVPRNVENMLLDNGNWFGALYYKPQDSEYIPSFTSKFYDRNLNKPGGTQQELEKKFYVLLGWNGADHTSNFKMVEVISFDPDDKNRILFGSDIFYFDQIPKYRAIFKYAENAPFSLNYNWVKTGRFGKKFMIVYDHMGSPKSHQMTQKQSWEIGPDGSYDALYFFKKGGYFEWYRNVELADKYISKAHRKRQEEIQKNRLQIEQARIKALAEMADLSDAEVKELQALARKNSNRKVLTKSQQKRMLRLVEEREKSQKEATKDLQGSRN
ncbi:MAG: hypothetical protein AAFR61_17405 [Bacteroidota bacterium]